METVAVSNVGAPVELAIARSITRLATYSYGATIRMRASHLDRRRLYSPCGCNRALRIHAIDRPARRETDANVAGHIGLPSQRRFRRLARWNEAGRSGCKATALERVVSTIGLCSNPAARLDFNSNVIWPALAAGFPPTSGRRDRAADRPRRPGRRSAAGRARRRLARPSSAYRTSGKASG